MTFTYPTNSVNADNYIPANKLGQDCLQVSALNSRTYDNFYYILKNPVTPLEEVVEEETVITYSKQEIRRESAKYLMSGGSRYQEGNNQFILVPTGFKIFGSSGLPIPERWSLGGTLILSGVQDIYSFIPDRAFDYAKEFEDTGGRNPGGDVLAEDIRAAWAKKVSQLAAIKY